MGRRLTPRYFSVKSFSQPKDMDSGVVAWIGDGAMRARIRPDPSCGLVRGEFPRDVPTVVGCPRFVGRNQKPHKTTLCNPHFRLGPTDGTTKVMPASRK